MFLHSHRIRRFLQFVVEECLCGQQHRLKEHLIGLEVFNRRDDFDPRVDSIVRVEARRLRSKIEEYYKKEGHDDGVRIELRKGSYIPIFEHRSTGMHVGYSAYLQAVKRHSIAIGPVTAVDGDCRFIEGITQQLAHELIQGGHFKVFADGNGGDRDSREGDRLMNGHSKPEYILEGRLERQGEDLQVRLQLKNVGDNAYVWSDAGHADCIERLAGSLNRAMTTSAGTMGNGRSKPRSSHRESFDLYLEGRYQWKQGTPEDFNRSVALFRKAVEIEPSYAAAWASLASAGMVSSLFGLVDPREAGPAIQEAALKATSLNPFLPEAHLALAAAESLVQWDWVGSERSLQRAIQLDGRDPIAHQVYALHLACRGMLKAALVEAECALELDPASLTINFTLGWLLSVSGRHDEAILQHHVVSRLAPDFPLSYLGLGWAHLGKRHFARAFEQFTKAGQLSRDWTIVAGCMGYCQAKLDQRGDALHQLARLTEAGAFRYISAVSVAAIYAGLGQNQDALAALTQAADYHDCSLPLQLLNPEFDSLREDPGFARILESICLGARRSFVPSSKPNYFALRRNPTGHGDMA